MVVGCQEGTTNSDDDMSFDGESYNYATPRAGEDQTFDVGGGVV